MKNVVETGRDDPTKPIEPQVGTQENNPEDIVEDPESGLSDWEKGYVNRRLDTARQTAVELHKYNPKYIFLCETKAIPDGYEMKEMLKAAYPESDLPTFYRIDPKQIASVLEVGKRIKDGTATESDRKFFEEKKPELEEFIRMRVEDVGDNILVYDSDWHTGYSLGVILNLLKYPEKYGLSNEVRRDNVKINARESGNQKIDPRKKNTDRWVALDLDVKDTDVLPIISLGSKDQVTKKKSSRGGYNFRARIGFGARGRDNDFYDKDYDESLNNNKDGLRRDIAVINQSKKIGKALGIKIKKLLEKDN